MQELTVCVFTKEQPNLRQLSRYGIYYDRTMTAFDGSEVPLPGGEEQYSWRPHGLQVRIHTTIEPQPCSAIIPPEQAVMFGLPKRYQQVVSNPALYHLLQQHPGMKFVVQSFPWDVLEFSRGESLYGTYFNASFNQYQSKYAGGVQEIGRVSNFVACKYNGLWKIGSDVSTLVRAALKSGTKVRVPDLTLVENTK